MKLPYDKNLLLWYRENARKLPWRETKDPYRIWVSEIMLQQTRVEAVLPYYHRFLAALPCVKALAEADEGVLLKLWEGLGYYSRVRNMQKAARTVMDVHGGIFPTDHADIRALCGVGDYTAGAIASFAFDLPFPAVDGNVLRVAARLCCHEGNVLSPATKKELTAAVAAVQPKEEAALFNQAMIELGALVCLPKNPRCGVCPMRAVCRAKACGREAELPVREKDKKRRVQPLTVLILRADERVILQKRPQTGLLAGLFELPSLPFWADAEQVREAVADMGFSPIRMQRLEDARHIFTHLEWHMQCFEVIVDARTLPADCLTATAAAEEAAKAKNTEKIPNGVRFLALGEDIDRHFALPSAFAAYRPYL